MAAKRSKKEPKRAGNPAAVSENAGVMVEQPITETLEKNYMPYAMSVIVSRAIPEIDGFKMCIRDSHLAGEGLSAPAVRVRSLRKLRAEGA